MLSYTNYRVDSQLRRNGTHPHSSVNSASSLVMVLIGAVFHAMIELRMSQITSNTARIIARPTLP